MIEYWSGIMDWPLKMDWVCEVCASRNLTWGIVHAVCRCDRCHAEYRMRDNSAEGDPITNVPISLLKEEYKEPAKWVWDKYEIPLDDVDTRLWETAFASAGAVQ